MRFNYIDPRREFFAVLGEKLGTEFNLVAVERDSENYAQCEALIVGLPDSGHPDLAEFLKLLQRIVREAGSTPVIVFLAANDRSVARQALSSGAYDYFFETGSLDELKIILRRAASFHELSSEVERLRSGAVRQGGAFSTILSSDERMAQLTGMAAKVATTDATVLITGESGTGKEVLANAIHNASGRASQPMIAVACSSLPESLIEAELFGHERGAFTGALMARKGRFEAAGKGTLFLDEIGELPLSLQTKLLRVLQERTFERLGSNQKQELHARLVFATNRNLKDLIKAGTFRADLYYRISTVEIPLPPLRERRNDILLLAHKMLHDYAEKHQRPARRMSPAVLATLQEYDWPGNVRELQNVIERAVVICEGPDVRIEHLPADVGAWLEDNAAISFEEEVRAFKRRVIQRALLQTGNNKLQAARSLKIARSSLHRLIDELEIGLPDAPEESADLNPPTDSPGPGTQPKPGSSVISFRRNMA